jgi:hypothetical protein
VTLGHFRRIGLDLVAALLAPHDRRRRAAAVLPSVAGGPGADFSFATGAVASLA